VPIDVATAVCDSPYIRRRCLNRLRKSSFIPIGRFVTSRRCSNDWAESEGCRIGMRHSGLVGYPGGFGLGARNRLSSWLCTSTRGRPAVKVGRDRPAPSLPSGFPPPTKGSRTRNSTVECPEPPVVYWPSESLVSAPAPGDTRTSVRSNRAIREPWRTAHCHSDCSLLPVRAIPKVSP